MRLLDVKPGTARARIIPSVAVMKGNPVLVKDERYHPFRDGNSRIGWGDLFKALSSAFGTVHYLDIGGISSQDVDLDLLRGVSSLAEVWADTGIAYSEMVIDAIMAGAAEVVVSTRSIASLDEIALSYELSENIIIEIDLIQGRIAARDRTISEMGPEAFAAEMRELGLDRFIIASDEGKVDAGLLDRIMAVLGQGTEVYVSVDSLSEVPVLGDRITGAIISASRIVEGVE